jgi:hypothetical protein
MKNNTFCAFNIYQYTRSLSLVCTLFLVSIFNFTNAQCPSGLTVTMASDLTANNIAIPFGTPIVITTTVTNNSGATQSLNLRTNVKPLTQFDNFRILCQGDYTSANNTFCERSFTITNGQQVVSSVTIVYTIHIAGESPAGRLIRSEITSQNNAFSCFNTIEILSRNSFASPIGTPGQLTTVTTVPPHSYGSLIIMGNVILDTDHTLDGVPGNTFLETYIYMDEGATLTIASGRTLTLNDARVFGQRSMWNSIIVEPGATLIMNSANGNPSIVEDGIRAIEARNGSNVQIRTTDFRDNLTSIFVPATFGSPQFINFSPFFGCTFEGTGTMRPQINHCTSDRVNGFPETGFELNDVGSLVQLLNLPNFIQTRFRNMSNGIVAARTRLFVNRARFENIKEDYTGQGGYGISCTGANSLLLAAGNPSSQDIDFNNCSTGISIHQFGFWDLAQINALRINSAGDNTGIGVRMTTNNFSQNYIYAMDMTARIGVRSLWNHSVIGEINNNFINATFPNDPSVSRGILAQENSTSGNWNIFGNLIDVQNAQTGIQFNSGSGATITDNSIDIQSFSPTDSRGISSGGSSNFTVSCNNIGVAGGTSSFSNRTGLYMVNGSGSSYTCNNTNNSQVGLNVIGECRPFSMSGNRFNNHGYGLVLNNATFIGEQNLRGNKWQGPFTVLGAQHLDPNSGNILQSQFKVSAADPRYLPTNNGGFGWFQVVNGTDFTCGNSNACPNGNPSGRIAAGGGSNNESFYSSAISEARVESQYAEEMKWTAQRNAYGRLMDNPNEQNSREITAFVGRLSGSSTGKLYQVEKSMKDMKNIGQEYGDILRNNTNSIKTLASEIAELEAKIVTTKGKEQAALMAQKKEKNAAIYRLSTENAPRHATIERKRNEEIQRLMRDNERISARLQPEINEKEVNAIYLATVAQGKMELNEEQKSMARAIAYQCPSFGGNAVFAARSLYSLVENVNFDDLELCNSRSELIQGFKVKKNESFKVSPNPATDVLSVRQASEQTEAGEWLILDMAGKLLLTKKVSSSDIESTINIHELAEGIYFVTFSVNGQKRFTEKFIKIKSN